MSIAYCTGDGTSQSPYIPTGTNEEKCQGFLNAIAEVASYVKLTSMIDFSTHPVYKTGFTEPIDFKCISLTADLDANGLPQYGVSGLIFKTDQAETFHKSCMFGFPDHNSISAYDYASGVLTVHGIKFVNFLVSNYGYSGPANSGFLSLFGVKASSGYAMTQSFTNCAFSGIVKLRTNYFSISCSEYKNVQYEDCSVYLTFQQPSGVYLLSYNPTSGCTGSYSPFSNMKRCCVVVTKLNCGAYLEMADCSDSTFCFNNLIYNTYGQSGALPGAGYYLGMFCAQYGNPTSGVSSNVIVANISRTVLLSDLVAIFCNAPASVVAIMDSDGDTLDALLWDKHYDSTLTDFASGNVGAYTPDDLKDVNVLVDCGFIP